MTDINIATCDREIYRNNSCSFLEKYAVVVVLTFATFK